jgi:hypothetical protein
MKPARLLTLPVLLAALPAVAHDPIFGVGPHVLFKDGLEVALEIEAESRDGDPEQALAVEMTHGITGDWAAGIELPYLTGEEEDGIGDIALFTKYRFWRRDSLGLQESAAVFARWIPDTGDEAVSKNADDLVLGMAYGYEGRKRYRWASWRYRINGENSAGIERGDRLLLDFVLGWRPEPRGYREPDTVWMIELNGEISERSRQGGQDLADSGGREWFLSPGIFWTHRNFAIKAGLQIPIIEQLNGDQAGSDYRALIDFEWHL